MNTNKKLKIIFANRKNCFDVRGGDTVQMEKTKEYLEKQFDISIKICLTPEEILADNESEIVHIFNIQTANETQNFIKAAKKKNKKIILSSIYWNLLDKTYIYYLAVLGIYALSVPDTIKLFIIKFFNFLISYIPFFSKKYKNGISKGLYNSTQNKKIGNYILKNADLILPNSDEERDELSSYFNINIKEKSITVPNATEFDKFSNNSHKSVELLKNIPKNFILQVGRIEPIKNQLNLVKALFNCPEFPILFIGKPVNKHYFNHLVSISKKRGNVFFINEIPHSEIMTVYNKAKVHVLPSFRESPGLVSLEAKAMGAEIVVSDKKYCPISYYKFDKIAEICDPYDITSIKKAVLTAYNKNEHKNLSDDYKKFYSYDNVAAITYEAYKKLLKEKSHGCINNISQL